MYTPSMLESIRTVEQSRRERLTETHSRLTAEEKDRLLRDFHPDYREDTMRAVAVGPNAGDRMPHELVDLLEARALPEASALDVTAPDVVVDVLVLGGGGAGTSAALAAAEMGANVLLATKLRLGDANTMMAQGGIQAADKEDDSPAIHFLDVLGGGGFVNDRDLVRALVTDAPGVIQWLEGLGCMFTKEADGTMVTIHGGGTSRKRMHYARDYTGAEIMRTLRDELRNRGLEVWEFSPATELLTDESGACVGAVLQNLETDTRHVIHARCTIMATGGFGRLHVSGFPTTNHYGATADGLVLSYRVGAKLAFLDATQFHPTGVAYPEQILGQLVTEKVRGVGAQLCNASGSQFVYPLETRDAVSSAIIRECREREAGIVTVTGQPGVWLDSPMIDIIHGPGTVEKELPAMYRQYQRFDIDMSKLPILVYPTLHYQNGGILIDPDGKTSVPNLFAAGESSGGVHGRNRLMGNSLLDILVFGRRAGRAAAAAAPGVSVGTAGLGHVDRFHSELAASGVSGERTAPILLPDYRFGKARVS